MTGCWYIVKVKPRTEKKMQLIMQKRHIWNCLPTYTKIRRSQRRTIRTDMPIFPGYMLVRCDGNERIIALKTNLVVSMVPLSRPRPVIHQLRQIVKAVRSERRIQMVSLEWGRGDVVRISHGPLKGIEGCIINNAKKKSIVIGIEVFGGAVSVTLSPEDCILQKE